VASDGHSLLFWEEISVSKSMSAGAARGASVSVTGVSKHYGQVVAVDRVSLEAREGEFISLLGPSGSGKTTLLMMIAGFELPDHGQIAIGGRDMTRVDPNRRNLGMVFQKYALFPHMSVAENIAFPLRMRKAGKSEVKDRVTRALEMVRLAGYGERQISQLSGGQQQRVALARATVFNPPVILMDEPLGALDKKLREHMQIEIKQLQRQLGATVIYVTHDQQEALTMSDRVAVMNHGIIEQFSSPRDLYDRPQSVFVADFVGDTNLLRGTIVEINDQVAEVRLASGERVQGVVACPAAGGLVPGERAVLSIRPEKVCLADPSAPGLKIKGTEVIYAGSETSVVGQTLDSGNFKFRATQPAESGDMQVTWSARDALVFADPGDTL
jgi:spermidine/putrescine ABC transporter ATP-binding subunit